MLSLVVHHRREGQRLATAAGAIVEHLLAGRCTGESGGEFANPRPGSRTSRGRSSLRWWRRSGAAVPRRPRCGCRVARARVGEAPCPVKASSTSSRVGHQRVDAKIERRTRGHRLGFRLPLVAERTLEGGGQPFGNVGADMGRRLGQVAGEAIREGFDRRDFGGELVASARLAASFFRADLAIAAAASLPRDRRGGASPSMTKAWPTASSGVRVHGGWRSAARLPEPARAVRQAQSSQRIGHRPVRLCMSASS